MIKLIHIIKGSIVLCLLSPFFVWGQSNYFDSLQVKLNTLSSEQQIEAIHAIPFDQMNSNTSSAIKMYKKSLSLCKQLNLTNKQAEAYEHLSLAYYYKGDYDLSVNAALQAIKRYEKQGNTSKLGAAYASLGYQMKRRNLPKAFEYMQKGINQLEKVNDQKALSAAYNNYGVLHEMDNDIDSALYYYHQGLTIVNKIKDSIGIPYSLNNIAGALVIKENYEQALPYYDQAFKIRKSRNDLNGLAENNTYYGDFYFKQQLYKDAIDYYKDAVIIAEQIKYTYLLKVIYGQLAKSYEALQQYNEALVYHKKTILLSDSLLNESTFKTINNLEIQFDTEKKEKQLAQQKAEIAQQELKVKQSTYFMYSIIGIAIIIVLVAFFVIKQVRFKQKQLLAENQLKDEISRITLLGKLNEERLRISRDLHDNIGAQLTFIISSIDNMSFLMKDTNDELKKRLNELNEFSRSAIAQLRDTIKTLNKTQ